MRADTRPAKILAEPRVGVGEAVLRAATTCGLLVDGIAPARCRYADQTLRENQDTLNLVRDLRLAESTTRRETDIRLQLLAHADLVVVWGDCYGPSRRRPLASLTTYGAAILWNPSVELLQQGVATAAHVLQRAPTLFAWGNREADNPGIRAWVYAVCVHAWLGRPWPAGAVAPVVTVPRLTDTAGETPAYVGEDYRVRLHRALEAPRG